MKQQPPPIPPNPPPSWTNTKHIVVLAEFPRTAQLFRSLMTRTPLLSHLLDAIFDAQRVLPEIDWTDVCKASIEDFPKTRTGYFTFALKCLSNICYLGVHSKIQQNMNEEGISETMTDLVAKFEVQASCEYEEDAEGRAFRTILSKPDCPCFGLFKVLLQMDAVSTHWIHDTPAREKLVEQKVNLKDLRQGLRHSMYSLFQLRTYSWSCVLGLMFRTVSTSLRCVWQFRRPYRYWRRHRMQLSNGHC